MNREAFNLSTWLEDKNKRVVTRNGRPVKIVCWDRPGIYPIIGYTEDEDNLAIFATESGLDYSDGTQSRNDLFFEVEMTEFENKLVEIIKSYCSINENGEYTQSCLKDDSKELLDLARKQLQDEYDKEIEHAYKTRDEVVYQNGYELGYSLGFEEGHKLGFKDAYEELSMPHLVASNEGIDPKIPVLYTDADTMKSYVQYDGYKLCVNEIFESLKNKSKS